jgi:hypothetical protein
MVAVRYRFHRFFRGSLPGQRERHRVPTIARGAAGFDPRPVGPLPGEGYSVGLPLATLRVSFSVDPGPSIQEQDRYFACDQSSPS